MTKKNCAPRCADGTSEWPLRACRSLAADIRPGRAAGGFRRGPDGGVFLLAPRRAGHGGGAGAMERREAHRGPACRGRRDAVLPIRPADAAPGGFRHRRAGTGGAGVRPVGDRPRDRSRHGVHLRGSPLRPRAGLLRQIPRAAGRARRESRRVFCPPAGRGNCLRSRTTWRWIT